MLSNNTFFETRIQQLLDGLIFVKNGIGVHVLKKWIRFYTLTEILSKIFVKKNEGKLGTLITILVWQIGANLIFINIYYLIIACTTYTFTFRKCLLIEKW